jgi:transcription initiation factor IIE alpha subunit
MDWELILKTYPDDREGILTAKILYDNINETCKNIKLPAIGIEKISVGDFQQLVPALAEICKTTWENHFNTTPAFDMVSAADAFIWGGSINVPETDSQTICTLFNNALRAVLRKLRDNSTEPENPEVYSGKCAFCGTHARIAFDEESQRVLYCPLCGFSWRFPRVRCTYCGNTDHEKLGFFEAEGIDGVKVYFCRECNHFIKAVDTKDKISPDAETMDALTLELDELAKEEGFTPVP